MAHMRLVWIVMALALIEYSVLGAMTGRARVKYKVPAPATTGDPMFERYYRVHHNTMEQLVVFLPALYLFARFINVIAAVILGLLFIVARVVYAMGYINDPEKRGVGAAATFLINTILLLGGLIGVIAR